MIKPINHLVSIRDISYEQRMLIYELAKRFRENPNVFNRKLKDKKFIIAMWEPSSRTADSSRRAAKDLGADAEIFHNFGAFSSEIKGESLRDTTRVIFSNYDCVLMRHGETLRPNKYGEMLYAPQIVVETIKEFGLKTKCVNLGTGKWEHPTQALLDEFTILQRHQAKLDEKEWVIAFVGDIQNSRTIHSLILLLTDYPGIKYYLVCPEDHDLPEEIQKRVGVSGLNFLGKISDLCQIAGEVDVFYMTRLQRERASKTSGQKNMEPETYVRNFGINEETQRHMKPDAIVMHPLPRYAEDPDTRQVVPCEIPFWFDEDPRAVYFRQADNGYFIRAGLFLAMFCHFV